MTNDEIKKAYEICASANDCSSCNDCPDCTNCASAAALNLIIEQEKEIEKLKAENIRLTTKLGQVLLSIDTVKEMNTMCSIDEKIKQAKIDVLNELKKKIHNTRLNDDTAEIIIEMIEELQNAGNKD